MVFGCQTIRVPTIDLYTCLFFLLNVGPEYVSYGIMQLYSVAGNGTYQPFPPQGARDEDDSFNARQFSVVRLLRYYSTAWCSGLISGSTFP